MENWDAQIKSTLGMLWEIAEKHNPDAIQSILVPENSLW